MQRNWLKFYLPGVPQINPWYQVEETQYKTHTQAKQPILITKPGPNMKHQHVNRINKTQNSQQQSYEFIYMYIER